MRFRWWLAKRFGICDHAVVTRTNGYAYVWEACNSCKCVRIIGLLIDTGPR